MSLQNVLLIIIGLLSWLYGARLHRLAKIDKSNRARFPRFFDGILTKPLDRFGLICQAIAIWLWSRPLIVFDFVDPSIWNPLGLILLFAATFLIIVFSFLGKWI